MNGWKKGWREVDEFRICIGGRANSNPIYEWTGVGREKRETEAEFYIWDMKNRMSELLYVVKRSRVGGRPRIQF